MPARQRPSLEIRAPDFTCRVVFSSRRTLCVTVRDDKVCVRAPLTTTEKNLEAFVRRQTPWILKTLARMRLKAKDRPSFVPEGTFFLLGRPVRVQGAAVGSVFLDLEQNLCLVPEELAENAQACERAVDGALKGFAVRFLGARLSETAARLRVTYSAFNLTDALGKWGSCSAKGKILLSWQLAFCPTDEIDYVICHELAHRAVPNHSKAFWEVVRRYCPEYEKARSRLKTRTIYRFAA